MDKLIKHLIASGIPAEQAAAIAATFNQGDAAQEDDLTKALQGLRSAFEAEQAEKHDEVLRKALSQAEGTTDAIAQASDRLIAEFAEQNAAVAAGLCALIPAVAELRKSLDDVQNTNAALQDEITELRAQFEDDGAIGQIRKSLGAPVRGQARTLDLDLEVLPAPGDRNAGPSVDDLVKGFRDQAFGELSNPATPWGRKEEISRAMAQLESGVPVQTLRKSLGFKN